VNTSFGRIQLDHCRFIHQCTMVEVIAMIGICNPGPINLSFLLYLVIPANVGMTVLVVCDDKYYQ